MKLTQQELQIVLKSALEGADDPCIVLMTAIVTFVRFAQVDLAVDKTMLLKLVDAAWEHVDTTERLTSPTALAAYGLSIGNKKGSG